MLLGEAWVSTTVYFYFVNCMVVFYHNSHNMGVSKNRRKKPKMDGENNGSKSYEQMDDLGVYTPIPILQHTKTFDS